MELTLQDTISSKKNLIGMSLPIQMAVYVPSTKDANVPVSKEELQQRVNEVRKYLATMFGGFSSENITGGYVSTHKELIEENIVKVIAFSTKESYEQNKQKLITQISKWAKQWSQEAIGVEFENDLYYINQAEKFSDGGKVENKKGDYLQGYSFTDYEDMIDTLKKAKNEKYDMSDAYESPESFKSAMQGAIDLAESTKEEYKYHAHREKALVINVKLHHMKWDVDDAIESIGKSQKIKFTEEQLEEIKEHFDDDEIYSIQDNYLEGQRMDLEESTFDGFIELGICKDEIFFAGRSGGYMIFQDYDFFDSDIEELENYISSHFNGDGEFESNDYSSFEQFLQKEGVDVRNLIGSIHYYVFAFGVLEEFVKRSKKYVEDGFQEEVIYKIDEYVTENIKPKKTTMKKKSKVVEKQEFSGGGEVEPSRYDWRRLKFEEPVSSLWIDGYKTMPTKSQVYGDLDNIKSRYREGSEYANFSPVIAVVYPYQYGWDNGYKINYSTDKEVPLGFFDEINGRRKVYELTEKMASGGGVGKVDISEYETIDSEFFKCLLTVLGVVEDDAKVVDRYIDSHNHNYVIGISDYKSTLENDLKVKLEKLTECIEYFNFSSLNISNNIITIPIKHIKKLYSDGGGVDGEYMGFVKDLIEKLEIMEKDNTPAFSTFYMDEVLDRAKSISVGNNDESFIKDLIEKLGIMERENNPSFMAFYMDDVLENAIKINDKTFSDGGEAGNDTTVATEILKQLGGMGRLNMMTGAYNFVAHKNGVSFKLKNPKANYVKVILNGMDLYDLEVGRIRGGKYTVVADEKGLYANILKPAIEKATGLYLSLEKGGGVDEKFIDETFKEAVVKFPSTMEKLDDAKPTKKEIQTDYKSAIADLIDYYSKKSGIKFVKYAILTQEQGEYLYNTFKDYESLKNEDGEYVAQVKWAYDGTNFEQTKEQDKKMELFLKELEETDFISFDSYDSTVQAYPITIHFIDAVRGRVQTRENISQGTDLFPTTARIKELNPDLKKISSMKSVVSTLLSQYTRNTDKDAKSIIWKKIQEIKEKIKEMENQEFSEGGNVTPTRAEMLKKLNVLNKHKGLSKDIGAKYESVNAELKSRTGSHFEEILKGGKSDGMDEVALVKKHGVSVAKIREQIEKGMNVEREHIDNQNIQREIAKDHIEEIADYYDRLEVMERQANVKHTLNAIKGLSNSQVNSIKNYLKSKGLDSSEFEVFSNGTVLFYRDVDNQVYKQISMFIKNAVI